MFHYHKMTDVLIWFFRTYKWIRDFNQNDWKSFNSQYDGKYRLCNTIYRLDQEVWWKKEVGCLHPDCFDRLVELSLFMADEEERWGQ